MGKIQREDIQIIAKHSNWSEKGIESYLKKDIYNDKTAWQKFLRLFFISAGVAFTTAGVIFFFAYNWQDLHKFIKLGTIEVVIIVLTLFIVFSKVSSEIKNIILTGVSILVGVLFAVFGQIYQTGANAYDFFLGWTLFITIWAIISNFAPLWLVYITLVNVTIILYSQQVAHDWSFLTLFTLLFVINLLFLSAFLYVKTHVPKIKVPTWFINILALATVSYSTVGIVYNVIETENSVISFLLVLSLIVYGFGIYYALKNKSIFFLSIIAFSIIIIVSALFIKISGGVGILFIMSLFIIISTTLVIININKLQKKWMKELK